MILHPSFLVYEALRVGNAIGAAFTDRRILVPVEAQLATVTGLVFCALAVLFVAFPPALAYPVAAAAAWAGIALLYRGYRLHGERKRQGKE